MNRLRAVLLVGLLVALAASSAASGQRAQPVVRRPNPLFVSLTLDYVNPITLPDGSVVTSLDPIGKSAIGASVADLKFLRYANTGDLGGFIPAPLGWLATGNCYPPQQGVVCPGRPLTGLLGRSGVPFYKNQANSKIKSYTYLHGIGGNGKCVACGLTGPSSLFPTGTPCTPAPNCGFGGTTTTPTKPTKQRKPKKPKTPGAGSCGTPGISIFSNLPKCRIYVVNRKPGDGTFEQMTITNTTKVPYVLSLKATGTQSALWEDLEMGIWQRGTPAPTPLPPLRFWTEQFNNLITLAPGQVVHYTIELFLPLTAGNGDQNLTAVVDFVWRAAQKT